LISRALGPSSFINQSIICGYPGKRLSKQLFPAPISDEILPRLKPANLPYTGQRLQRMQRTPKNLRLFVQNDTVPEFESCTSVLDKANVFCSLLYVPFFTSIQVRMYSTVQKGNPNDTGIIYFLHAYRIYCNSRRSRFDGTVQGLNSDRVRLVAIDQGPSLAATAASGQGAVDDSLFHLTQPHLYHGVHHTVPRSFPPFSHLPVPLWCNRHDMHVASFGFQFHGCCQMRQ
jgi:hypothetical protein